MPDLNTCRTILLAVDDAPEPMLMPFDIGGIDDETLNLYALLLADAGLLTVASDYVSGGVRKVTRIVELTWEGYDWVDAVRDPNVWLRTLAHIKEIGAVSLERVMLIARGFA